MSGLPLDPPCPIVGFCAAQQRIEAELSRFRRDEVAPLPWTVCG
jgi:hypothetical protein